MFRTINLRRSRVLRIVVFAAIVACLIWYVTMKRAEFLKMPASSPETPAGAPPSVPKPAEASQFDYFADSRIERERQRSQELERLRDIASTPSADAQVKKEANQRLLALAQDAARESEVEHLVRARGYDDAIAFIGNGGLVVVVRARELTQIDVARISDIVTRLVGIKADAMRIIARQ